MDILQNDMSELLTNYNAMIDALADRLHFENNTISYRFPESREQAYNTASENILATLTEKIESTEKQVSSSTDRIKQELSVRAKALNKLKNSLITAFSEASRLHKQEKQLTTEASDG